MIISPVDWVVSFQVTGQGDFAGCGSIDLVVSTQLLRLNTTLLSHYRAAHSMAG